MRVRQVAAVLFAWTLTASVHTYAQDDPAPVFAWAVSSGDAAQLLSAVGQVDGATMGMTVLERAEVSLELSERLLGVDQPVAAAELAQSVVAELNTVQSDQELSSVSLLRKAVGVALAADRSDLAFTWQSRIVAVERTQLGADNPVLVEPTSGEILLDGVTARTGDLTQWRRSVGAVFQDDRLFSGSLADNISFFDPEMDMGAVEQAARQARIHDDIMMMPMRYQSLIGDMGSSLSGGQRQRVLIARALYRRPKVLVLDEGTANLDATTEDEIVELIAAMPITRIVVAHRPAMINRASRILSVRGGRVEERSAVNGPQAEAHSQHPT